MTPHRGPVADLERHDERQQQTAWLAGQDSDYLLKLLRGFKVKTAFDLDGTMAVATQPLSDEDIQNLVQFLASLSPEQEMSASATSRRSG